MLELLRVRVCSVFRNVPLKAEEGTEQSYKKEKKPRKNIVVSIIRVYFCPDLRWDTLLGPRYIAKKKKGRNRRKCIVFCEYTVLKCTKCTWLL